ncbi:hypothetical protein BGZ65_001167 [Modicella reniformis]|uniref:TM7S3/TM198-like domain-containing protein n=1 Tax=Modicella reniformis TaxID=1440133 RepID=A0A9P6MLS2_9FUNG|nr:hypothetical protein BGZ65_001167 [Modicella reniformis]
MPTATSCLIRRRIHLYLLVVLSILIHFSAFGAPTKKEPKKPRPERPPGETIFFPERITAPAAIAGVIMIITGFFLCFFATMNISTRLARTQERLTRIQAQYRKATAFLIGFYLFGGIAYIIMVNLGVSSATWLFVGSLLAAIVFGSLRMIKPFNPPGAELLGPLAMHCLVLLILGGIPGGVVASKLYQVIMFVVLDVLGITFIFFYGKHRDHIAGSIGFPILGAYALVAGMDFFARTGFLQHADWFMNTQSDFDPKILAKITVGRYFIPIGLIAGLAGIGLYLQFTKGSEEYRFYERRQDFDTFSLGKILLYNLKRLILCGVDTDKPKRIDTPLEKDPGT